MGLSYGQLPVCVKSLYRLCVFCEYLRRGSRSLGCRIPSATALTSGFGALPRYTKHGRRVVPRSIKGRTRRLTSNQQTNDFSDGVQFYWDSSFCWRKLILKTYKLVRDSFLVIRGWLYSKGAGKLKKEWLHLQLQRHLRQHLQQRQGVKRKLLCCEEETSSSTSLGVLRVKSCSEYVVSI